MKRIVAFALLALVGITAVGCESSSTSTPANGPAPTATGIPLAPPEPGMELQKGTAAPGTASNRPK
jgi:hypothetical protein